MFTVKPRALASFTDPFRGSTIQRRNPRPKDILIDIDYAGIGKPTSTMQVLYSATPSRASGEATV
jgi:hypothetical protein